MLKDLPYILSLSPIIPSLDSFSPFYLNNFTIESTPKTPEIIYGTQLAGTSPEMALSTNNESWIIGSIEQLSKCTESKLSNLRGFGKKALTEVKKALEKKDLTLSED